MPEVYNIQYRILESEDVNILEEEVIKMLKNGWHTAGGVSTRSYHDGSTCYIQAVEVCRNVY